MADIKDFAREARGRDIVRVVVTHEWIGPRDQIGAALWMEGIQADWHFPVPGVLAGRRMLLGEVEIIEPYQKTKPCDC